MNKPAYLTLVEWNEATNEQRHTWLREGRLIRPEDRAAHHQYCIDEGIVPDTRK